MAARITIQQTVRDYVLPGASSPAQTRQDRPNRPKKDKPEQARPDQNNQNKLDQTGTNQNRPE